MHEIRPVSDQSVDAGIEQSTSNSERRRRGGLRLNHDQQLILYKRLINLINDGVILTDTRGRIIESNNAFSAMSGFSRQELLGKNPRILRSERQPLDFYREMWKSISEAGSWEGEVWNKRKDGTEHPQRLRIHSLRDSKGHNRFYIGVHTDLSLLKSTEASLNKLAYFDALTGLPNRVLFQDRMQQAIARALRSRHRLAILYLDLDQFKHVNDSFGHHIGDCLLREAARRFSAQVREADTVCRLGGDEFTIILEDIGASEDAGTVAAKIIHCLKEPFQLEGQEVFIGTSIGIALFPFDGNHFEELTKRADTAMYEAKSHGRGQYRFASGESGQSSRRRIETENRLRKAIDFGQFFMEFQPQVSAGGASLAANHGILGAEALVRWRTPEGKIVYPDNFIDIAEETGLIVPIGGQVLLEACIEAQQWVKMKRPLVVSVNVSQLQFEHGVIVKQVENALAQSMLPPEFLKLEITESLFSRNMHQMADIMLELKRLGVRFALDDFGTGYSSLRYIDRLPFDTLKIDKSFIQRIESPYEGGEIATAIVALARSFGLESMAEGVETIEQLNALRSRGCDSIQGFYVSKPLPSPLFRGFIRHLEDIPELEALG